ncbi:MAG: adenylosuccinate lyase [Clostridiales Family XIII bacterium]|jgi:adenylosuccinate lyase|nr:adenylosuccinate lyase [Clostridiales Family XIII bacterium]
MSDKSLYENPLISRYASREMAAIFSADKKFSVWRRLWIALAEAEQELGLPIDDEQIAEMKRFANDINHADAERKEAETRHDVMSHVYAYGLQCPKAKPIIHLGATSAYVGDNTDILVMREALELLRRKLLGLMELLSRFALRHRRLPTLGFTHFQAAQLTTVGKRAALWLQDFYFDYMDLVHRQSLLPLLGVKGTTGTQASFLELFDGDGEKVKRLEALVAAKLGVQNTVPLSGQTYSRKIDTHILDLLSGIAQSAHKMTNDIRLLQHLKEVEEPFEANQIGSSAMAYKRNPMRSERVASLARYVIRTASAAADTAAAQWFERTLDDSAGRRLYIPQSFLGADAILDLCGNIAGGLVVRTRVIQNRIMSELPFIATENILMEAVKRGGDRQELHERIRRHSMEAGAAVKDEGLPNDLLRRIADDPAFHLSEGEIERLLSPEDYIGRAAEQTEEFIRDYTEPILAANRGYIAEAVELKV